jgi:hypothetical protein
LRFTDWITFPVLEIRHHETLYINASFFIARTTPIMVNSF